MSEPVCGFEGRVERREVVTGVLCRLTGVRTRGFGFLIRACGVDGLLDVTVPITGRQDPLPYFIL